MRRLALVLLGSVVALIALGPAAAVPGDTVADRVLGQGSSFTTNACNLGGLSSNSLCDPAQVDLDTSGNLYVPDALNNRVLEYDTPLTTDTTADRVFGQNGSFTSNHNQGCPGTGFGPGDLCQPTSVAIDQAGNVYVADNANNRVLEYDTPLNTDTVADRVFGQGGSFGNNPGCNQGGLSASSLCNPYGVAVDSAGNLYVADTGNSRVLEFNTPLATDTVADRVFGQGGSFTSGTCNAGGISAGALCYPYGVAVDSIGNVYVADAGNRRVLEYDSPLTTDTTADRVFGQGGSFTTNTTNTCSVQTGVNRGSVCDPKGLVVGNSGNLYVADEGFNRVLEYDSPLTTDTTADRVFGQNGSFTSYSCNLGGPSASSLCEPYGVTLDAAGNLYVGDIGNNRVLEFDGGPATVGGIAELPALGAPAEGSGWSSSNYAALGGGLAAALVALTAGGWYARRRWLRFRP